MSDVSSLPKYKVLKTGLQVDVDPFIESLQRFYRMSLPLVSLELYVCTKTRYRVVAEHNCGDLGEYIKRVSVCERLRPKTVGEVKVS